MKIRELKELMNEIIRGKPSLTMQRIMKTSQEMDSQSGISLARKLGSIKSALEDVKREAKGLDHKTQTKLNQAILDLGNMSFRISKDGISAVESHED